jgi:hypothetical protein
MIVLEDQTIEVGSPANLSSQAWWCDMDRQTDWVGKPSHVDRLARWLTEAAPVHRTGC